MCRYALKNILVVLVVTFSHPAAGGITGMQKGQGGSTVSGSAGPSGSQGAASDLEHCNTPMGAITVVEPQSFVVQSLADYGLQSPTGLIRMLIQQSNCFVVVERGVGMHNMMQERSLAQSGQLRERSNIGGGQMVAADFILTPSVVFSENNAGGVGGALGGLLGKRNRFLGAIAGGLKFKEAQTTMLLADARSGVQVAAAEGSARKADFKLGGLLIGGGAAGAGLGGYGNTNEGKVIAASLADNYNGIVRAVRSSPGLQRDIGTLAEESRSNAKAGQVFNEGDVLRPKISNVKLYDAPDKTSTIITKLGKGEEMIYLGEAENGFISVETNDGSGWVRKILVAP